MGMAMDYLQTTNPMGGLLAHTVYHGSPHKFNKFDMSKIGTGEGAQAYGHGLYMAESPAVAKQYQKLGEIVSIGGKPVSGGRTAAFDAPDGMSRPAIDMLGLNNWNVKATLDSLGNDYANATSIGDQAYYMDLIRQIKQIPQNKIAAEGGNLYKVDIPDEAIPRMLDWDAPLRGKQRKIIDDIVYDNFGGGRTEEIGKKFDEVHKEINKRSKSSFRSVYNYLSDKIGGQTALSNALNAKGIPGIKYLDGTSRTAGEGTRNYVLFQDDLARILETNNIPSGLEPWTKGEYKGLLK